MSQLYQMPNAAKLIRGTLAATALLFALPLSVEAVANEPITTKTRSDRPTSGGNYTRLLKKADGTYAAQFANRTFLPPHGNGPRIILISAIHIGSQAYYDELQKLMDAQDVLLFEGISEHPDDFKKRMNNPEKTNTGLYGRFAKALGLVPQVTGLNYDREHFINADLSPDKLKQILEDEIKKGGKDGKAAQEALAQFQELTQLLSGQNGGLKGALIKLLIGVIEMSPSMRDIVLLEIAGAGSGKDTKLISERLDALIIHDRNDAAMLVLKTQLSKSPAPLTIGIFYGADHLADMEKTLIESFGYRPNGEDIWLTAFVFDPAKSKLKEKNINQYIAKANLVEEKPEETDDAKKAKEKAPAQN